MARGRREPRSPGFRRTGRQKRESYNRVLIVCEGEKTETIYFQSLRDHHKLSMANIEVVRGDGTDPMSIYKTAMALQKKEIKQGEKFDCVYCVFDRDEHTNFIAAVAAVKKIKFFETCLSYPCFEYWLLCHFKYSRAAYTRTGGRTAAACCERDLKREYPDYKKGGRSVFSDLSPRLDDAIRHAERAMQDAEDTGERVPSTQVHELVRYLIQLKEDDKS